MNYCIFLKKLYDLYSFLFLLSSEREQELCVRERLANEKLDRYFCEVLNHEIRRYVQTFDW